MQGDEREGLFSSSFFILSFHLLYPSGGGDYFPHLAEQHQGSGKQERKNIKVCIQATKISLFHVGRKASKSTSVLKREYLEQEGRGKLRIWSRTLGDTGM